MHVSHGIAGSVYQERRQESAVWRAFGRLRPPPRGPHFYPCGRVDYMESTINDPNRDCKP